MAIKKGGYMGMIDFKNASKFALQTLPPYLYDLSARIEEKPYLLYYKGAGMFPRGDIQALFGKKKSGKTTVTRIFITAMLTGEYLGFTTKDGKRLKVLIVDTEQAPANVGRNTKRIHEAAGLDPGRNNPALLVLQLRPYSREKRLQIICEEIPRFNPDFVLIDGIVDICKDYNDTKESGLVITKLMELSARYQCAILNVMHFNKAQGKATDTEQARGHLGAELTNKCSESYISEREESRTEVTATDCRNEEIPPFAFEVVTDGEAESITIKDSSPEARREAKTSEIRNIMQEIFKDKKGLNATTLIKEIKDLLKCEDGKAKRVKKDAENSRIIKKENGYRGLFYLVINQDFDSINLSANEDEDII